jgi:branched-chain amino acid transport system permease protein
VLEHAVAGLAPGGGYALLALALVMTYQATRTVNFATAATGAFGTFLFAAAAGAGVPYWLALLLGVLCGAAVSTLLGGILVVWFDRSDVGTRSVVTIAQLISTIALAGLLFGGDPRPVPSRLDGRAFAVAGTVVSQATVVLLVLAVAVAAGVGALFARTLLGRRLRAVSERPQTAELLGIRSRRYGTWVWAVSGAFSVVAVTLISTSSTTNFPSLALLVVPGLAAALFGLFQSLAWAVVGAVVLGVLQGIAAGTSQLAAYSTTAPFFALLVILLFAQRGQRWEDAR